MPRPLIPLILTVVLVASVVTPAAAAIWGPDGGPVCIQPYSQKTPHLVSDGQGGMFVAWADARANASDHLLYAQRIDGTGKPVWSPPGGREFGRPGRAIWGVVDVISDGAFGAFVIWSENGRDIRMQKIDAWGTPQWSEGGVQSAPDTRIDEIVAVCDGVGGIIIAWPKDDIPSNQIYAQRMASNGDPLWPVAGPTGGMQVFGGSVWQGNVGIVADGSGGAFISGQIGTEIQVQRIYGHAGTWHVNPLLLGEGRYPSMASDGSGGVYIAWEQEEVPTATSRLTPVAPGDWQVLVQGLDYNGLEKWSPVVTLASRPGLHIDFGPAVIHDHAGDAVVFWYVDNPEQRIYAQKVDASRGSPWPAGGVEVGLLVDTIKPFHVMHGAGTDLLVATGFATELRAQSLDVSGASLWAPQGNIVMYDYDSNDHYDVASDGCGGLLYALDDDRDTTMTDIYAQAVNSLGDVYAPDPVIASIDDIPGDQGGWVRLTINRSDRDNLAIIEQRAVRYDVWREVPPAAMAATIREGATANPPDAQSMPLAHPGVTLFEAGGKRYLDVPAGGAIPGGMWEAIGGFNASQTDVYTFAAPTFSDSSESGCDYVSFFVSVQTTNPTVSFASDPDSGCSVDNIPPHVPTGMAVAYNTGSGNQIAWDPSPDGDFKYFRIYRSTDPGFTPSPATYVHGTAGTAWQDPVAGGYQYTYKLTAVDMADNESDPTGGTATGVRRGNIPAQVTLGQNIPNPFNPATAISIGLPQAAHVTLTIYDVGGRLVRTLADGPHPAGYRSFTWDGRDASGRAVSSGVYFYRMNTEGFQETKKMLLLK